MGLPQRKPKRAFAAAFFEMKTKTIGWSAIGVLVFGAAASFVYFIASPGRSAGVEGRMEEIGTLATYSDGESPVLQQSLSPVETVAPSPRATGEQSDNLSHVHLVHTLFEYAAESEPEYTHRIIAYFEHEDASVRQAAVEAVVQFGSREAIPALRRGAEVRSDIREKIVFLEAAEFLELPTRTELRAQGILPPRKPATREPRQ